MHLKGDVMKLSTREKHWLCVLIVLCAILPMLVLFLSPGQWILGRSVWLLLLLAIGNGLLWLGLAVAWAAVNRAATFGFTPLPIRKHDPALRSQKNQE